MIQMAVVGATGLVGREMLATLGARRVPVSGMRLMASARSAGSTLAWNRTEHRVEDAESADLRGIDVALFSAGAETARRLAPRFAAAGAVVIDNSSAFREDPAVPLVVPEVNGAAVTMHRGIIANPNCSTIQLVVALKPFLDTVGLRRVTVATYQSVSGQGWKGVQALEAELRGELGQASSGAAGAMGAVGAVGAAGAAPAVRAGGVFAHPIAFESLPHCGPFDDEGWSLEERKLMRESSRILGVPGLRISATAVRVPVRRAHSEAVWIETHQPIDVPRARAILRQAAGVEVIDDPGADLYPLARRAEGTDAVYVGRLRRDPTVENGLVFWVVADNLRKGAALNAVQIIEELVSRRMLSPWSTLRGV